MQQYRDGQGRGGQAQVTQRLHPALGRVKGVQAGDQHRDPDAQEQRDDKPGSRSDLLAPAGIECQHREAQREDAQRELHLPPQGEKREEGEGEQYRPVSGKPSPQPAQWKFGFNGHGQGALRGGGSIDQSVSRSAVGAHFLAGLVNGQIHPGMRIPQFLVGHGAGQRQVVTRDCVLGLGAGHVEVGVCGVGWVRHGTLQLPSGDAFGLNQFGRVFYTAGYNPSNQSSA